MQPDAQAAMQATLAHGPSRLPPSLFAGPTQRILLGLKAQANSIAHARFVAIEETYPRTRALIGAEAFHAVAERHLTSPETLARPLATIGEGFAVQLFGAAQDLARLEWVWLRAHGAPDAPPFDLHAIKDLSAEQLAEAPIRLHPASRLLPVDHKLAFDSVTLDDEMVLITRPYGDVLVTAIGESALVPIALAQGHCTIATLLAADTAATTLLIANGALTLSSEIL